MGTTSEKLTYLNTTKTLIKDNLNLGGANITTEPFRAYSSKLKGIYKDFLANGTDTLWNNWEKVSGTGTEITLNNTMEGKMKVDLKGNTYQYSTTGKNLIEPKLPTETWKGITITNNGDGSWTLNGTATETNCAFRLDQSTHTGTDNLKNYNGTYTLSCNELQNYMQLVVMQDTTYEILLRMQHNNTPVTATFNKENCFIYLFLTQGKTINNLTIRPQLELGNQPTTWEPYTGNQPSPNPDYPQDIQVVSGDNTINVCGANVWDEQWELGTFNTTTGVDIDLATQIRSKNLINIFPSTLYYFRNPTSPNTKYWIMFYDKEGNIITGYNPSTNNGISGNSFRCDTNQPTIMTPTNASKMKFYLTLEYGTTYNNDICINVNNASINGNYYPYEGATYPISLGNIELCKIGTYQDKIAKSTGKNLFDISNNSKSIHSIIETSGSIISDNTLRITNIVAGGWRYYFIPLPNTKFVLGKTITMSVKASLSGATSGQIRFMWASDTWYTSDLGNPTNFTSNGTYTCTVEVPNNIPSGSTRVCVGLYSSGTTSSPINSYIDYSDIQVEVGTATSYEPYGKVWYLNKQIGKYTFTGSETLENYGSFAKKIENKINGYSTSSTDIPLGYCNISILKERTGLYTGALEGVSYNNNEIFIRYASKTIQQLLEILQNNDLYYILATPTYEEITGELLSQLEALAYSYDEQTNISQVNDDLAFVLDITALKEMS